MRLLFLFVVITATACKKMIEIEQPVNSITTSETFSNEANATAALIQVYNHLSYNEGNLGIFNGLTTLYCGLSSDELNTISGDQEVLEYQSNNLQSQNSSLYSRIWFPAYQSIYYANAVIEGVEPSAQISDSAKRQLIGEAKFLRAFINFYLVNIFGDIPLVTTNDWRKLTLLPRTAKAEVYKAIITDLKDAQQSLPADYSVSSEQRTRANSFAATALLARVYLYLQDWSNAEQQANTIVNANIYFTLVSLQDVFRANSQEAIFQFETNNMNWPYTVREGNEIVPYDEFTSPNYYLTGELLADFEAGDQRRTTWVDSNETDQLFYFPYKYTQYQGEQGAGALHHYIVLRLAEQYLIRAEARAHQDNIEGAIEDLNLIRTRAGLAALSLDLSQDQLLTALARERRIELFAEWGHRWFDLKRTNQAVPVLGTVKPGFVANDELYPIPYSELEKDPALSQNSGY